MTKTPTCKELLARVDFSDERSIEAYAFNLEDMTFQDVLDLGIYSPKAWDKEQKARSDAEAKGRAYDRAAYKGGVGTLIEERFFGYDANSDDRPDFPDAGVELKTTCFDIKRNGVPSAGERLSVTMIPFDKPIELEFDSSHLWAKSRRILFVFYLRDRNVSKYDQPIKYVTLFTPPADDLAIIREDYETIVRLVREGRADELSEGLTTYLGAATKGASEAKMWAEQFYPRTLEDGTTVRRQAKRRVFSLKRQYMDYVLNQYVIPERERAKHQAKFKKSKAAVEYDSSETSILSTPLRKGETFADRIQETIKPYLGCTDVELRNKFKIAKNKSTWVKIAHRILGVKGNHVEEFQKANISLRVIRLKKNSIPCEHLSLDPFEFSDLMNEDDWYSSELFGYLDEMRFCFVIFKKDESGDSRLDSVKFWSMPERDIDCYARQCWEVTREVVSRGVRIIPNKTKSGVILKNDLPGSSFNGVVHVRHHSSKTGYRLEDGKIIGDLKFASMLPDGRYMTRQSFWIDKKYLKQQLFD